MAESSAPFFKSKRRLAATNLIIQSFCGKRTSTMIKICLKSTVYVIVSFQAAFEKFEEDFLKTNSKTFNKVQICLKIDPDGS